MLEGICGRRYGRGKDWGAELPGEDGMTASGQCGEDWGWRYLGKTVLPPAGTLVRNTGIKVPEEDSMTVNGHCGR